MTNKTEPIEVNGDNIRYILEHLESDLETNRGLRGQQGFLECLMGQAFFMSSALLTCQEGRDIRPVWMSTYKYGTQKDLKMFQTQKAILAVERLNEEEWKQMFDYIGEYTGKV